MVTLAGYLQIWGDEAAIDGRRERFVPYALAEPVIAKLVVAHDDRPGAVLARTSGGLRIAQDDLGARFAAVLADRDPDVRALVAAVRSGMRGCSFIFRALDHQDEGRDGVTVRRARLSEVTVTGDPVYRTGGRWIDDEDDAALGSHLARLRAAWHSPTYHDRPLRIMHEREAFARAQAWAHSLCS